MSDPRPTDADTPTDAKPAPRHSAVLPILVIIGLLFVVRFVAVGNGRVFAATAPGAVTEAAPYDALGGDAALSPVRSLGVWVAAIMTLCIFSFLWRDNPFYKTAEAILVGVSAAYAMVLAFWTVIVPNLLVPLVPSLMHPLTPGRPQVRTDDWWLSLIPLVLGVMLLMRLSSKGGWIARWPLALIIGTTAGLKLMGFLQADFLGQIASTIKPLVVTGTGGIDWAETIRNSIIVLATLSALTYFFFSAEHRGVIGVTSRVGIWVLMVTFGAAFAYTVMGRIALLAIRMEFLFDDWLWLIDPSGTRFAGT